MLLTKEDIKQQIEFNLSVTPNRRRYSLDLSELHEMINQLENEVISHRQRQQQITDAQAGFINPASYYNK